jgi:hypothetical protein
MAAIQPVYKPHWATALASGAQQGLQTYGAITGAQERNKQAERAAQEAANRDRAILSSTLAGKPVDFQQQVLEERIATGKAEGRDMSNSERMLALVSSGDQGKINYANQKLTQAVEEGQAKGYLPKQADLQKVTFERAKQLRGELDKKLAGHKVVIGSYDKFSGADKTGAGDMARIFNYMKMLDPGVSVMEGDIRNAENTQGATDKFKTFVRKVKTGEKLSKTQRENFDSMARQLVEKSKKRSKPTIDYYVNLGKKYGIDKDEILVSFWQPTFEEKKTTQPTAAGLPAATQQMTPAQIIAAQEIRAELQQQTGR